MRCDPQHDFALMAGESGRLVVLALLQAACLRKCDEQGFGLLGWPFSSPPDLIANCGETSEYILSRCLDQFCLNVVDSRQLPFLQ